MFYLVRRSARKDAKRHIVVKGTFEYVMDFVERTDYYSNNRYVVEIYSGDWRLVKVLQKD